MENLCGLSIVFPVYRNFMSINCILHINKQRVAYKMVSVLTMQ